MQFIDKEPQFKMVQGVDKSDITDVHGNPYEREIPMYFSIKNDMFWGHERKKILAAKKFSFPSADPCQYLDEKDILPENMYKSVIERRMHPEGGYTFDDDTLYVEDPKTAVVVQRLYTGKIPARTYAVSAYMFHEDPDRMGYCQGGKMAAFSLGYISLFHAPYNVLNFITEVTMVKDGMWFDADGYWMNTYVMEQMKGEQTNQPQKEKYNMRMLDINFQTAMGQVALIEEGIEGKVF